MKTKICTFCILLISVLAFSYQKASAQQWVTAGNNLVGGEVLGSLNNQPVNIVTNGTSRIYVTADGKVGIGTTAPTHTLTLPSTSTGLAMYRTADQTTNYERVSHSWSGTSYVISSEKGGTGTFRDIAINVAGAITQFNATPTTTAAYVRMGTNFSNVSAPTFDVRGGNGGSSGSYIVNRLLGYMHQAGSAGYTMLFISPFEQSIGSGNKYLIDAGTNTADNGTGTHTSKFVVTNSGSVGAGTSVPAATAILDLTSTTKGALLPRMTTAQKNAIVSPATGLLIYETDSVPGFYYYNAGWQPLTPSLAGFANTTLSNLTAPTALNVDLLPGNTGAINLGSSSFNWKDIYYSGDIFLQGNRFISTRGSNTFFGTLAGNPAITGSYNTATGTSALAANVTGSWNTADGYTALTNANNAYSNTGIGYQAALANTTGSYNTATGVLALGSNTTGVSNSATGVAALNNLTSGSYNVGFGYFSGANLPTGNYNTYLGSYADGPSSVSISNATAIGYNAAVTASNSVRVGNTSVTSIGGQVNWTAFSDGRFKQNIKENVPGLEFINKLRPVTYNLDIDGIDKTLRPTTAEKKVDGTLGNKKELTTEEMKAKEEKAKIKYTGFIAQEVEETAKKMNYDFSGVDRPKNNKDFYGLRYGDFVVPLVKAIQELSKKNESLVEQNKEIKQENGEIKARLEKIEALLASINLKGNTTNTSLNDISLDQNDPNPFGSTTRIPYNVPTGFKSAQLLITDITGKTIKSISLQKPGKGLVNVDATLLSTGAYNYTLIVDGKMITTKKMIVVK